MPFRCSECDFRFVDVNWEALDFYLQRKGARGRRIATGARSNYESLHQLLGYLRANGVNNPHNFLQRSEKNNEVQRALDEWCESFRPRRRDRRERRRSLETESAYESKVEDENGHEDEDDDT
jgi:hypothetical protein